MATRSRRTGTGRKPRRAEVATRATSRPDRPSTAPAAPEDTSAPTSAADVFPVVGIGASAGGLEAFSELLTALPPNIPMAVVVVQHLDPSHVSLLSELLTRTTPMPVVEVRADLAVEPGHVYVIPPNTTMTVANGVLRLTPRQATAAPHMPIDVFLRSLADDRGERAIAVILSGGGSDGALGIRAIKEAGGVTFAQDPHTASQDGMPRSAIASGTVDFVLSPRGIARELARLVRHPSLRADDPPAAHDGPAEGRVVEQIFRMLRQQSGVDFRLYRQTTIRRRIARRMLVHQIDTLDRYRRFLEAHPEEVQSLYHEVLINVTRFFREPEAFDALQRAVRSNLARSRDLDRPVRVWVPGCASGEEAYSVAIAILEALDGTTNQGLQLFATDVAEAGLARARAGVFPPNIELDVSPARLRRFFAKLDGQYRVRKSLRDACIFARHDLTKDPPFSGVDVISCRNVLIYLDSALQRRIIETFHYALRPEGVLLLGSAESIGPLTDVFTLLDRQQKLYGAKPISTRFGHRVLPHDPRRARPDREHEPIPTTVEPPREPGRDVDRLLLGRYAPASVLINEAHDILQVRGHTSPYLETAQGHASLNVLKMAREGLLIELRAAILAAHKRKTPVRRQGVRMRGDGRVSMVDIEVIPVPSGGPERNYLVVFEKTAPAGHARARGRGATAAPRGSRDAREAERLRQELTATKEYLQAIVEEREAANEELRAANEELQSTNEELQSTNEEMETAKEELQSVNEELTTVNEELQQRNTELALVNNDLNNLITSVNIPILILGNDRRIRRFSPRAATVFNLLPADVGRPLDVQRSLFDGVDLERLCAGVIETAEPATREVRDREGRWYSLWIRPYRTADNVIEGLVLTLIDITTLKASLDEVASARDYSNAIVDTVRSPLLILDEDLRIHSTNRAFYEMFRVTPEQSLNRVVFDLGSGQWEIPALRRALAELTARGTAFEDFEVEHEFPTIGLRTMLLNGRVIRQASERSPLVMLAIEDITVRRDAEREFRASEEMRYRRLFETARDAILLIDETGQITNANPHWTRLSGLPAENVIGRELWELGVFRDGETARSVVEELRHRDFLRYEDVAFIGAGRADRRVELACNAYHYAGRRVIQCIVRDITDRVELLEQERRTRRAAEAANRAKDDFLSVLSHELRTPLTAMLGWVRVLRKGAMDPTKTADALETVERNTRLLAQLIEDLLDVSRIAAGKLAIEVRQVDLGAVMGAAIETVREAADVKGVRLDVQIPERTPTVRGDRHRLQQVVWNLVSNAIKFTPKGGRIDVRLEDMPAGPRITVSDTGRGISPQLLPLIFDRFRQGESVSTRTQGGLGLGLAIVHHVVELHGGRVTAFSAGAGQGATFTIDLPRSGPAGHADTGDDGATQLAPDPGPAEVRLGGLRVLIVEDDGDTGRMLAQALSDRGAHVTTVETAAAALVELARTSPHVLLSDIGLPGEDGYALIGQVRALPASEGGRIPAIALTAFAREADMHRAIEAGFDVHVAKPIDPSELAGVVQRVVRLRTS